MASRSIVWKYFEPLDESRAKCKVCQSTVKTAKNTTNLFAHLRNKHPVENAAAMKEKADAPKSKRQEETQQSIPSLLSSAQPYGRSSAKKQKLDASLLLMLTKDMQPARIVEDDGFRHFVKELDSRYELPSRRTIMRDMLPKVYTDEKQLLMNELMETSFVALTTDIWTSSQTQAYLSVTAHYITRQFQLTSAVLKTVNMTTTHTGENIAAELTKVIYEFSLKGKVVAVVSDNASNMTAAVRILGLRHLPCFAHTLNLIVRAALQETPGVTQLVEKVKTIVEHFHRSVNSSDRLRQVQGQLNLPEVILIIEKSYFFIDLDGGGCLVSKGIYLN